MTVKRATLEGPRFGVVADTEIQSQVSPYLPRVLHESAIDIVLRPHGAGPDAQVELSRDGVGGVKCRVLPEVKLLKERKIGVVAYVASDLEGMRTPGPSQVVNILIPFLNGS